MATIRRRQTNSTPNVNPDDGTPAQASGSGVEPSPPGAGRSPVIPSTRTAAAWASLAAALVLLVVVLVFILQNLESVRVSFFTFHWRIPLALDLLLSGVLGGLIVFTAGSLRILQLRRVARRHAKSHAGHHSDG